MHDFECFRFAVFPTDHGALVIDGGDHVIQPVEQLVRARLCPGSRRTSGQHRSGHQGDQVPEALDSTNHRKLLVTGDQSQILLRSVQPPLPVPGADRARSPPVHLHEVPASPPAQKYHLHPAPRSNRHGALQQRIDRTLKLAESKQRNRRNGRCDCNSGGRRHQC